MRFWDSSAILPLAVFEPNSTVLRRLVEGDTAMTVWWASPIEVWSALARRRRKGPLDASEERDARQRIAELSAAWTEILPSEEVQALAGALLLRHPLRASDALQLAAAITAAGVPPRAPFVTLDARLAEAAAREGFTTLP